jgi:hypothetical protein
MNNPFTLIKPDDYTHLMSMGGKYEVIEVDYGDPEPTNLRLLPDNTDLNYKKAIDTYVWNGHTINSVVKNGYLQLSLLDDVIEKYGPFYDMCVYLFDKDSELFNQVKKFFHINNDEHNVILFPSELDKHVSKDTLGTFKDFMEEL